MRNYTYIKLVTPIPHLNAKQHYRFNISNLFLKKFTIIQQKFDYKIFKVKKQYIIIKKNNEAKHVLERKD